VTNYCQEASFVSHRVNILTTHVMLYVQIKLLTCSLSLKITIRSKEMFMRLQCTYLAIASYISIHV